MDDQKAVRLAARQAERSENNMAAVMDVTLAVEEVDETVAY